MFNLVAILRTIVGWFSRRLERVTSRGDFIPEVDGIRFIAITAVLVFHSVIDLNLLRGTFTPNWAMGHGPFIKLVGLGWFGVEIFFVLSGFIVALPFARHALCGSPAPDLGRYYLRRLTRIEPPYLIALTAIYLLSGTRKHFLPDYLASVIYSHQYIFGAANPFALMMWSLEVEVGFYILAPWLTRVYLIRSDYGRWLFQLFVIGGGNYATVYWLGPVARTRATLLEMIPYFLVGILLADWYASGLLRRARAGWDAVWDLTVAVSLAALFTVVGDSLANMWTHFWQCPLWAMLLFVGVFKGRIVNRILCLRPVTLIGGMCYTLYLAHNLILYESPSRLKMYIAHFPYWIGVGIVCFAVVPAVIMACVPLYLAIERPFMNGPGSRYLENSLRAAFRAMRGRRTVASEAAA